MLERILNYEGEIHWHGPNEPGISPTEETCGFCEIFTEITHEVKYGKKPGFVTHLIIPVPHNITSEKVFYIPERLNETGVCQIIFKIDKQNSLHGNVYPFISTDKEKDEKKLAVVNYLRSRLGEELEDSFI